MPETPFDQIKKTLSKEIPPRLLSKIPRKWEKIGDVLLMRVPDDLTRYGKEIGETYARVLQCKTVLRDAGTISGVFREPNVELLFGSRNTETVHRENGIRFRLDPQKIMFSSGNMDERIRMAQVSNNRETVVDLFAGIGYFTLPIAVYRKPKKIYACEMNTVAYRYLCENIVLNDVTAIVEPLLGDNRKTAPKNVADRVLMGYLRDTYMFVPTAIDCLKNNTGFIHYHEVCPDEVVPDRPLQRIEEVAQKYERELKLLNWRQVKSYAPGVSHIVLDLELSKR